MFFILTTHCVLHLPLQIVQFVFAFSQAYIFHIRVSFFTPNLDSQHSTSALSTMNFFSAVVLAGGYDKILTIPVYLMLTFKGDQ